MKKVIALSLILAVIPHAVLAQTSASPAPAPITLAPAEVEEIARYVSTLPYAQAAPIMAFLQRKAAEAQAAKQATKP